MKISFGKMDIERVALTFCQRAYVRGGIPSFHVSNAAPLKLRAGAYICRSPACKPPDAVRFQSARGENRREQALLRCDTNPANERHE